MKENWIAKLVELLNEYKGKTYDYSELSNLFYRWEYEFYEEVTEEKLISKKFWFIQRLVKHFQLNVTKIDSRIALSDFNATDRMLMALAISDNPIALLVDCLE